MKLNFMGVEVEGRKNTESSRSILTGKKKTGTQENKN